LFFCFGLVESSNAHRWASTSTSISAISDIRHRHLLVRYRKKICRNENCHSDIGRVPISTSESIPISNIQKIFITSSGFEPKILVFSATLLIYYEARFSFADRVFGSTFFIATGFHGLHVIVGTLFLWMSDIGYRIKVYSDIRYNVGLRSLQSDIGSSDIKLSLISLITDIGVSAHLWQCIDVFSLKVRYCWEKRQQDGTSFFPHKMPYMVWVHIIVLMRRIPCSDILYFAIFFLSAYTFPKANNQL
jgi:hypothetical protein